MQCNNVTYQNFLSFEYVVATKAVLIMKQQGKTFFSFVCNEIGSLPPYSHAIYFEAK